MHGFLEHVLLENNKHFNIMLIKALKEQTEVNQKKTSKILNLYESKKQELVDLSRSQYGIYALDYIFKQPIFKGTDFTKKASIPVSTAKRLLLLMRDYKIIKTIKEPKGRRSGMYFFEELINITEN